MSDREKVLKGLACVAQKKAPNANPCAGCGYADRVNFSFCVRDIAADALALLKEQEATIRELEEKLRLLEYGNQDILQSGLMPAT